MLHITCLYNLFLFAIFLEVSKETSDWLNHMRAGYYLRVKGITLFLFYSFNSISNLYQTVLYFFTILLSFTNYIVIYSPQRNHLKGGGSPWPRGKACARQPRGPRFESHLFLFFFNQIAEHRRSKKDAEVV